MTASPLYLDDLTVGDTALTDTHTIDEQQIVEFATGFDPQPFHLDREDAEGTFFRGLAASGSRPTRPGDVMKVKMTVLEVRPSRSKPDQGLVTVEVDTFNQDGDVLQHLVTKVLVFGRPTAAQPGTGGYRRPTCTSTAPAAAGTGACTGRPACCSPTVSAAGSSCSGARGWCTTATPGR